MNPDILYNHAVIKLCEVKAYEHRVTVIHPTRGYSAVYDRWWFSMRREFCKLDELLGDGPGDRDAKDILDIIRMIEELRVVVDVCFNDYLRKGKQPTADDAEKLMERLVPCKPAK